MTGDVADELDCATTTASDHLQKAEAKLVRAGVDDVRSGSTVDDG